jgi:methanol--5-hydroxybenzimidazolylcobamide Co-methyltransferase
LREKSLSYMESVANPGGSTSMLRKFTSLAISRPEDLQFGSAPHPVTCGSGLRIGGGQVYPELNFTLPTMSIEAETWESVKGHYQEIGDMIVKASRRLRLPGLVVEFELLPPMTENPAWGGEITALLRASLKKIQEDSGIPVALRVTPTDIRDRHRPPLLRRGEEWDLLCASLESCARNGADILSIESVGGKEVHDEALLYGDIRGALFALGVLAPRDMEWLWNAIVEISGRHRIVAGADSACGFANTAMQLASQGMLPEVLATVIRAASAVRSLMAFQCGAVGPSKDCAYEGPILKAITGAPIAMEGKSASCAHFSPVGNVAAAMCDLWSNESVQNVRLLSGSAPEAYLELLAYDCRLFNAARERNFASQYQSLLVGSDILFSPQAMILSPESTVRVASAIVRETTPYRQTVAAAQCAVELIREAIALGRLDLPEREGVWLSRIEKAIGGMPAEEETLIGEMTETYAHLFLPSSYGL